MIKTTHKIKGFALTEMMVVIVISTIVVGLAFTILGIVQKNMTSIENNYEYQSQIQSLEVALTIDFNKYTDAHWNSKENKLTLSSPIQERIYTFSTDSIINDIDAFMVRTKKVICYLEGEEITTGRTDAIKLTFDTTTELHRIFIYKHNDPTIHF